MPFPYSGNPKDALLRHYPSHSRGTGRDGSVGIATRYGLDGPGIESRWGRDFPRPSRPALGPHPSSYTTWHRVSFPGVKRPGRGVDHPSPCSAEVKERVEPYLYSPSGSSWPVLGRTYFVPVPLQPRYRIPLKHVMSRSGHFRTCFTLRTIFVVC